MTLKCCGSEISFYSIIQTFKCYKPIFISNGIALQGSDSRFGKASSDAFWLDDVQCRGSEYSITECPHNGWGKENCARTEAAKVICT